MKSTMTAIGGGGARMVVAVGCACDGTAVTFCKMDGLSRRLCRAGRLGTLRGDDGGGPCPADTHRFITPKRWISSEPGKNYRLLLSAMGAAPTSGVCIETFLPNLPRKASW